MAAVNAIELGVLIMQTKSFQQVSVHEEGRLVGGSPLGANMSIIGRTFVWSLIFEPLLFFVLFERSISGVTSNLGRILQIAVIFALMLRVCVSLLNSKSGHARMPRLTSPLYINYGIYYLLAILAGVVGLVSGAYDLPFTYDQSDDVSGFSLYLNSEAIRPLFEYFVSLYYFIYFAILPQYLLKTEESVKYFFSVFKIVFTISLLVGAIDFVFSIDDMAFIPRHIADGILVGMRFHGLAGEPRDAFVYLFLGLAILHLNAHFNGRTLNKWWIIAIVIAALLTQSASGLLGIVCFMGLYGIYSLSWISIRGLVNFIFTLLITSSFIFIAAVNSERIMDYLESASNIWFILESGEEVPYLMKVQMPNIYPLYDLTVKFRELNILPIFIGSGFGSTSVINNIFSGTSVMENPNSQFVRIVFESGLIGTYFFIMAFAYPVAHLTKYLPAKKRREFVLVTLLLIGCFLAHRSAAGFIYLGIFIAAFRVFNQNPVHASVS